MVLADLGADVLRVERHGSVEGISQAMTHDLLQRGKQSVGVELKHPEGVELALDLVERADVLIEGYRPGVMERLGLGPDACLARNERLVYGRVTGWGQDGPLAMRAGHDIDYVAAAGVLGLIGRVGDRPIPPLNLVGDFGGGGLLLAFGIVCALLVSRASGKGQVVDAAMVDGAALLNTMMYGELAAGRWHEERGTNLIDSGAPFYEVYECADGRMVAVGALEDRFYQQLMDVMEFPVGDFPDRFDRSQWPEMKRRFADVFRRRTRDHWLHRAEGRDCCVAPVLSMSEVAQYPHNVWRRTFVEVAGVMQPAPAPRFSTSVVGVPGRPCRPGENGGQALADWGIDTRRTRQLIAAGLVATA
jgi:alpha-methylacyl-CoA racemase